MKYLLVLVFFTFTILSSYVSADEWFKGSWSLDFDHMLETTGITEAQIIEMDKNMLVMKYFGLVISDTHITNTLHGKEISAQPYSLSKEKGVLKIMSSNNFGPETNIVTKNKKGICMKPALTTDRYGTYKPPKPLVKCYVPINA